MSTLLINSLFNLLHWYRRISINVDTSVHRRETRGLILSEGVGIGVKRLQHPYLHYVFDSRTNKGFFCRYFPKGLTWVTWTEPVTNLNRL